MLTVIACLLGLGALSSAAPAATAQEPTAGEIHFVLTGIDVEEGGTIRCALYRDEATWLEPSRRYRRSSARVVRRQAACVFRNLPPGTYAMAALHDADGDREMDKSLIGLPQEGYAISRNEHDAMSRPDFDEAAVRFDGGRLVTRARMRY